MNIINQIYIYKVHNAEPSRVLATDRLAMQPSQSKALFHSYPLFRFNFLEEGIFEQKRRSSVWHRVYRSNRIDGIVLHRVCVAIGNSRLLLSRIYVCR